MFQNHSNSSTLCFINILGSLCYCRFFSYVIFVIFYFSSLRICEFCVEWGRSPKLEVARSIANNICRANKMSDCVVWNNNSRGFRNLIWKRCWNEFSMTVGVLVIPNLFRNLFIFLFVKFLFSFSCADKKTKQKKLSATLPFTRELYNSTIESHNSWFCIFFNVSKSLKQFDIMFH